MGFFETLFDWMFLGGIVNYGYIKKNTVVSGVKVFIFVFFTTAFVYAVAAGIKSKESARAVGSEAGLLVRDAAKATTDRVLFNEEGDPRWLDGEYEEYGTGVTIKNLERQQNESEEEE